MNRTFGINRIADAQTATRATRRAFGVNTIHSTTIAFLASFFVRHFLFILKPNISAIATSNSE